jgi:tetratricopeptide (TPR) repeat protein
MVIRVAYHRISLEALNEFSVRKASIMLARLIVFAGAVLMMPGLGFAQAHDDASGENNGSVTFNTSCNSAAQPQFNRAVALMHSFQFGRAMEGFHATLVSDPSCSMANWGIALSSWGNPFAAGLKPQAHLEQGLKAVEQARAVPAKTERERAYVDAIAHLYTDTATTDQRSRMLAYESAMDAVRMTYPDDVEASIFYALALAAAADPADKTYAKQLKAGAILESLFVQYPNHPGLAHYIIHAYDVPPLAARAVGAAKRYSEIAPSSPHALHMPSHTFTRVGDWQDSIDANIASAAAARSYGQTGEELHASDYMIYAYLQTAQDSAARHVVESAVSMFSRFDPAVFVSGAAGPSASYFARAAIPARYCLELRAWADAARLEVHPSPLPYADAITYFARGLGAAHGKDRAAALSAIDSLRQMGDKLKTMKEGYWANQVEIQRQEVSAWLAFAEGDRKGALIGMRTAAELENRTEKNAITPGPLAPARELLGELLLESNQPAEALKEFEATLTKEPNRFRSLYGAAEAAKLSGDRPTARTYFQQLLRIAERADKPGRQELAEAGSETRPE